VTLTNEVISSVTLVVADVAIGVGNNHIATASIGVPWFFFHRMSFIFHTNHFPIRIHHLKLSICQHHRPSLDNPVVVDIESRRIAIGITVNVTFLSA
jgi:hypothetical protein